jgi:tetratricopeptide (TPR) repeat protein
MDAMIDDGEGESHWNRTHSQWKVMSELLDSLYQMGQLHQLQGIPGASRFYFRKGLRFADAAKLPNVKIRFLLALADLHRKQHDWDESSKYLAEATAIQEASAAQPQGPGWLHVMKLAGIRIAHVQGEVEFAQGRAKEALVHFNVAAASLRSLLTPSYIKTLRAGRAAFELKTDGTPNERAVAKAWSRTAGAGKSIAKNLEPNTNLITCDVISVMEEFMVDAGKSIAKKASARPAEVAATSESDYPTLSGELSVVLARAAQHWTLTMNSATHC